MNFLNILTFGILVVFSNSINAAAAKPSAPATTAAKPWNVCPDGESLPKTNFQVQITENGVIKIETPEDPNLVAQLRTCKHFSGMIENQTRAKIREKYGYDRETQTYKTDPTTATFLLKQNGEIEEVHATAAAKPAGLTDMSKINKERQK